MSITYKDADGIWNNQGKFAAWDRPLPESCPSCQKPYLVQKFSKREGPYIACPSKECDYRRAVEQPEGAVTQGA